MNEQTPPLADVVAADFKEAVDALLAAASITQIRANMKREDRREFLMQEAAFEAKMQDHEGDAALAAQLRGVVERLRILQPETGPRGGGDGDLIRG